MGEQIHKYSIGYPAEDVYQFPQFIPIGAEFLQVAERAGEVYVWAKVVEFGAAMSRSFLIISTGKELPEPTFNHVWKHIQTITLVGSGFTKHIFIAEEQDNG